MTVETKSDENKAKKNTSIPIFHSNKYKPKSEIQNTKLVFTQDIFEVTICIINRLDKNQKLI